MKSPAVSVPAIRKRFAEAGFEIIDPQEKPPGSFAVKKYNCLQYVGRTGEGDWVPSGPPYFLARGFHCELEDRGYQKFWYGDGKRFPIRVAELKAFHQFAEEVRKILVVKSLYNESLGSICARTTYDRLSGRPDR